MTDVILILMNHGGVRQILKVEALDPNQQSGLKEILTSAIPKKQ